MNILLLVIVVVGVIFLVLLCNSKDNYGNYRDTFYLPIWFAGKSWEDCSYMCENALDECDVDPEDSSELCYTVCDAVEYNQRGDLSEDQVKQSLSKLTSQQKKCLCYGACKAESKARGEPMKETGFLHCIDRKCAYL